MEQKKGESYEHLMKRYKEGAAARRDRRMLIADKIKEMGIIKEARKK